MAGFSIPLFRKVPEPPRVLESDERPGERAITVAFVRLGETLRELRGYRQAFIMMLAFLVYNDGIGTRRCCTNRHGPAREGPQHIHNISRSRHHLR